MSEDVPNSDLSEERSEPRKWIAHRMGRGVALVVGILSRWIAVGTIFTLLVCSAFAALYGDNFVLSIVFFAAGILPLLIKTLNWEEIVKHEDRMWASIVIVLLAVVLLLAYGYLVHYTADKSLRESALSSGPPLKQPTQYAPKPLASDQKPSELLPSSQKSPPEPPSEKPTSKKDVVVRHNASSPRSRTVPKQQECQKGSICNQDSPNFGRQEIYNYGPKLPHFLGSEAIDKDARGEPYPTTDKAGHALTNVRFYADSAWDDPRIAVICDRPCTAYQAQPFQPSVLITPTFLGGSSPSAPNLAVFVFTSLKPMSADTYYVLTVASKDSSQVGILKIAPFVGEISPH